MPTIIAVICAIVGFIGVIVISCMSREPAYLCLWLVVGITSLLIHFVAKIHYLYRILHIAYLEKIENHVIREDGE